MKKKKHVLPVLAKMTHLASFQPIFVVAAKPTFRSLNRTYIE